MPHRCKIQIKRVAYTLSVAINIPSKVLIRQMTQNFAENAEMKTNSSTQMALGKIFSEKSTSIAWNQRHIYNGVWVWVWVCVRACVSLMKLCRQHLSWRSEVWPWPLITCPEKQKGTYSLRATSVPNLVTKSNKKSLNFEQTTFV